MEYVGTTIRLIIGGVACFAGWRYLTHGARHSTLQKKSISSHNVIPKGSGTGNVLSSHKNTIQNPIDVVGEKWFNSIIDEYSEKTLAFFISQYAWTKKISAKKILSLQGQYGRVTIQPTIVEFESGFKEQGLSFAQLNNFGIKWLKNRGIESDSSSWKKLLEKNIIEQKSHEAEKIIEHMKS